MADAFIRSRPFPHDSMRRDLNSSGTGSLDITAWRSFRGWRLQLRTDEACLAMNENPVPSDNFDYELRWVRRFNAHAWMLVESQGDAILCGDFNVVPTNEDIYNAGAWRFDAVLQPETRRAYRELLAQG